jgi:hypothetical protein
MSKNSIKQTVETVSAWRETLSHVKERKAKADARRRKNQQKVKIKNSSHHA